VIIRPNGSMQTGLHKTGRHCQTEYRKKENIQHRETQNASVFLVDFDSLILFLVD